MRTTERWCCLLIFSRPLNLYLPAYLYIHIIFAVSVSIIIFGCVQDVAFFLGFKGFNSDNSRIFCISRTTQFTTEMVLLSLFLKTSKLY